MPGTVTKLRRTYRGEECWFPLLDDPGPFALRRAFIGLGISPPTASGLVFFLDDQRHLDRHQDDSTRVRYRRILSTLDVARVADLANRAIPRQFNSDQAKVA